MDGLSSLPSFYEMSATDLVDVSSWCLVPAQLHVRMLSQLASTVWLACGCRCLPVAFLPAARCLVAGGSPACLVGLCLAVVNGSQPGSCFHLGCAQVLVIFIRDY